MIPHRLLPTVLLLAVATCVGEPPTGPDASGTAAALPVRLAIIEGPADVTALPINRIRAVVRSYSVDAQGVATAGEILVEESFDVDPASESWEIGVRVPLPVGITVRAVVELSLLHVSGSTESVEFSGIAEPVLLQPGASMEPADVTIVRGPLSNLFATDVTIRAPPEFAVVGVPAPLYATTTTAEGTPSVFWVSLDQAVGTVTDAVLTGITEGTVRIAAAAGAHADTVSVRVSPAPVDPALYMYGSTLIIEEGDTLTLTLVALNGGGASLDGTSVSVTLPAGLEPAAWEMSAGSVDPQADVFTWAIGPIEAGRSHTLTLDLWVDPAAQLVGRTVSIQAELVLPQMFQDPDVANNFQAWAAQVVVPLLTLAFPSERPHL